MWSFTRADLYHALHIVAPAISDREWQPILKGVLVEFGPDSAQVRSTDLSIGLLAHLPVTGAGESGVCLPGDLLLNVVDSWDDGPVSVEIDETTRRAVITTGRNRAELAGHNPEEFPANPDPSAEQPAFTVVGADLLTLLTWVKPAVETKGSRAILSCALLESTGDGTLYGVGSDGIRLHIGSIEASTPGPVKQWMIPYPVLGDLQAVLRQWDSQEITATVKEGDRLRLTTAEGEIVVRLVEGQYFDWKAIVSARGAAASTPIRCQQAALLRALRVMITIAKQAYLSRIDSAGIYLDASAAPLVVRASARDVGSARAEVDSDVCLPESAPLYMNAAMLEKAVAGLPGPDVVLSIPQVPSLDIAGALVLASTDSVYRCYLIPMRESPSD